MNCKSCNTRIPAGASHCPNCGQVIAVGFTGATTHPELTGPVPLSQSTAREAIELEEIAPTDSPRGGKKSKTKASASPAEPSRAFGFTPRPAELRALLAEKPTLVEPGLSIYKQKGKAVGEGFETDMGVIDLLASDDAGGLVAISIAADGAKNIVADMLGRVGWIRKHVAKTGQDVRAIVLVESLPEAEAYAAAAVGDTVSFKTYQVALTFSDLEI